MVIKENYQGTIIIRKCVKVECNIHPVLNDYYFCPDCMIISEEIPFEVLHIIIKKRIEKIQKSKKRIAASYNDEDLNNLCNNLEITLQSLLFFVFYQKEFFEEKQENDIINRLTNSEIITGFENIQRINENYLRSLSRFFITDIHFTFDSFFTNHYHKIHKKDPETGFYKMIKDTFENNLNIKSKNNPFLPLTDMRNSQHNSRKYKNIRKKKKLRDKSYDTVEYDIDSYKFKFEHDVEIQYGPLGHDFFLFDKCLEKLEQDFIPKFF